MSSVEKVKVILLGDSNVGKTSLVHRLSGGLPNINPLPPTVGIHVTTVYTTVGRNDVRLSFWDMAGQNNFRHSLPYFYKDAHIALLVYDVTCAESFDHLHVWLLNLNRYAPSDCKVIIFGNKCDLPKKVDAKKNRLTFYTADNLDHPDIFEVSAITMTAPLGHVKVIATAGIKVLQERSKLEKRREQKTNEVAVAERKRKRYGCCFAWLPRTLLKLTSV